MESINSATVEMYQRFSQIEQTEPNINSNYVLNKQFHKNAIKISLHATGITHFSLSGPSMEGDAKAKQIG